MRGQMQKQSDRRDCGQLQSDGGVQSIQLQQERFIMQDCGIRFMVATDVHLGHKEKHPVRFNDSYEAFEEVIAHAKAEHVDFLLLGGDLFDEVNPTKECFFQCLNILKQNVFGNNKVGLKVTLNGNEFKTNLENQDLNVSLPIFTIHGNHDYPTNQFGKISACDLLQASNYVTYFGKHLNLHKIVIRPLIITKEGSTSKIALYGLGYIKDQILNELFEEKKITFEKPEGDIKNYTNIFVFHQNRYKKGFRPGAPIHQSFNPRNIPDWMNLVIWGHEHEAIYKLEYELDRPVYQPGSTVLTSYVEAQSFKKQCVLINIKNNNYEIQSLLLEKSYRPMFCLNFQYKVLKTQRGQDFDFFEFLDDKISELIGQSLKQNAKKPIIRLKVECTGVEDIVKSRTIQTKYADRVANGEKILQIWRRKAERQVKIEDQEMIKKIKNKELENSLNNAVVDEIGNIMVEETNFKSSGTFQKKDLLEVVNYLVKTDNSASMDIIKKKCIEIEKKQMKSNVQDLNKLGATKETEFKRALKYLKDRVSYHNNGKTDLKFYQNCTEQEFFDLKDQFMNENKFYMHCKYMQESKRDLSFSSELDSKSINNSSRENILNRTKVEQNDSSIEIIERSDSQDCCSRAEKTIYDEKGNQMKYFQAQEKIKNQIKNKSKKSALSNLPKVSETKVEKKMMKSVRFSKDFA